MKDTYFLQVQIHSEFGTKEYYYTTIGLLVPDYLLVALVKEEEENGDDSLIRDLLPRLLKFSSEEDVSHYMKVHGYTANHFVVSRESIVERLFD